MRKMTKAEQEIIDRCLYAYSASLSRHYLYTAAERFAWHDPDEVILHWCFEYTPSYRIRESMDAVVGRNKREREAIQRLADRGLFEYVREGYWSISVHTLTPLFWEMVGLSPALYALAYHERELEDVLRNYGGLQPTSWPDAYRVGWVQHRRGEEMTAAEVYRHDRACNLEAATLREERAQEQEHLIAIAEIMIAKGL